MLEGIVGSQAYGLATPSSDIDKLGIFVRPTADFWQLKKHDESYTSAPLANPGVLLGSEKDDYAYHEAEKYVRLALKCNPTILELLWLDHEYYTLQTSFGEDLIWKRSCFLSKNYVRSAYLGYATQQLTRILRRQNDPFDKSKADAKNARHLWRLCSQGAELWMSGQMNVKLDPKDAEYCHEFGQDVANGHTEGLRARIKSTEALFDNFRSPLPDEPDTDSIERWLYTLRSHMLSNKERSW